MSDELKPCPICGRQPEIIKCCGFDEAHCTNDDCELSHTHVPINLSRLGWQSRPIEDALSAENAKLRGALEKYELAIKEAEAILGGEYADFYAPFYQMVQDAKSAQEALKNGQEDHSETGN